MKLYIITKVKIYRDTDEVFSWSDAFRSRGAAVRAMRQEIAADIDADMEDSEDCDEAERDEVIRECTEAAIAEGEDGEAHDAVLHYGGFTAYYDITETTVSDSETIKAICDILDSDELCAQAMIAEIGEIVGEPE